MQIHTFSRLMMTELRQRQRRVFARIAFCRMVQPLNEDARETFFGGWRKTKYDLLTADRNPIPYAYKPIDDLERGS